MNAPLLPPSPGVPPLAQGVPHLVDGLRDQAGERLTAHLHFPAEPGAYDPLPEGLDPRLARALERRGIPRLYRHQREAWEAVHAGSDCVVVTPTASGKSLCYHLPALHAAATRAGRSLYLFPTKALSQDQMHELLALSDAGGLGLRIHTFDGDTPGDARRAIREHADLVITNPDMLHQGILPHHTKWAQFFESLRYVVVDELHGYRGVFGAHVANVLRRLERVCRFYGSRPQFVLCSATIANPAELAERLVGRPVRLVDRSGAPRGERHLLLWNPPLRNAALGLREPARRETTRIAAAAVDAGLRAIVFARTRLSVEVLTKYLKDRFDADPRKPPRVSAYRGGYLPGERRRVERALREDGVDCVVSTSALELGVDIGSLDVSVLNGYPGSVAGTWQRLGRAGRRERPSLGVLVATSAPLDQFIVRNPGFFADASPEHARIDPDQLLILLDHIRCAAFELPFETGEPYGGRDVDAFLRYLAEEGVLHHEAGRWHWMDESYPANAVSLRSVAEGNFVVVDCTRGRHDVLAEVDYAAAATTLYEGAIYLVQARPWQVERLDWEGRKAFVTETRAEYYTDAIDYTRLKILERFDRVPAGIGTAAHGETHVVRRVAGYKKIRYYTHENVGYGHVRLPDHEMHTTALWWALPPSALDALFHDRWRALEAFLAAAHALHHVAALLAMCELRDLGRTVASGDGSWFAALGPDGEPVSQTEDGAAVAPDALGRRFRPAVFLYDNYPGGIGLTEPLFGFRERLVAAALDLVVRCPCQDGCPSCVGPVPPRAAAGSTPKDGAARVLASLRPPAAVEPA